MFIYILHVISLKLLPLHYHELTVGVVSIHLLESYFHPPLLTASNPTSIDEQLFYNREVELSLLKVSLCNLNANGISQLIFMMMSTSY